MSNSFIYSYQYDATNVITAIVKGQKEIVASNCVSKNKKYNILRYIYDSATDEAFIAEKDVDGNVILADGKAVKDATKLGQKISLTS